jgi:hypothetical protein
MNLGALAVLFTLGAALIALFSFYGAVLSLAVREVLVTSVNLWLGRHWMRRSRR